MGERGPKTKPAALHILQGNRSKKSVTQLTDGVFPSVSIPDIPSHLDSEARKEWNRVTPELQKLGIISEIDRSALAVYCQAYSRWIEAERNIMDSGLVGETPKGFQQMSVWLQVSNRAVEQMHKFMGEFGMSPSSRTRVTPSPQADLFGSEPEKGAGRFFGN